MVNSIAGLDPGLQNPSLVVCPPTYCTIGLQFENKLVCRKLRVLPVTTSRKLARMNIHTVLIMVTQASDQVTHGIYNKAT